MFCFYEYGFIDKNRRLHHRARGTAVTQVTRAGVVIIGENRRYRKFETTSSVRPSP